MSKQHISIDFPLTVDYSITECGSATYSLDDTRKIVQYALDNCCSIKEAITDLADSGTILGFPEEIGKCRHYECEYTPERIVLTTTTEPIE